MITVILLHSNYSQVKPLCVALWGSHLTTVLARDGQEAFH